MWVEVVEEGHVSHHRDREHVGLGLDPAVRAAGAPGPRGVRGVEAAARRSQPELVGDPPEVARGARVRAGVVLLRAAHAEAHHACEDDVHDAVVVVLLGREQLPIQEYRFCLVVDSR